MMWTVDAGAGSMKEGQFVCLLEEDTQICCGDVLAIFYRSKYDLSHKIDRLAGQALLTEKVLSRRRRAEHADIQKMTTIDDTIFIQCVLYIFVGGNSDLGVISFRPV